MYYNLVSGQSSINRRLLTEIRVLFSSQERFTRVAGKVDAAIDESPRLRCHQLAAGVFGLQVYLCYTSSRESGANRGNAGRGRRSVLRLSFHHAEDRVMQEKLLNCPPVTQM